MIEIPLGHHVYSSLNGYKTIHATAGIPPAVLQKAEGFARRCYRLVGRRPLRGHFRAGDEWSACLRGVQVGTDHVGRPRTAVHTILIRDEDSARLPWFSPFQVPDELFLTDANDLQVLAQELPGAWSPDEARLKPEAILERFPVSAELARKFLPAMLESGKPALVLDSREQAFATATLLSYFLPAGLRRTLSWLDRAFVPPVEGDVSFQLYFFGNRPDPSILEHADFTILDLDRGELQNPPAASAYAAFVQQGLAGGRPQELLKFLNLAELYERRTPLAKGYLARALEGFKAASGAIGADGRLQFRAAPEQAFDGLGPFADAGCGNVVLAILNHMAVDFQERYGERSPELRKLREAVDRYARLMGADYVAAREVVRHVAKTCGSAYGRSGLESSTFDGDELDLPPEAGNGGSGKPAPPKGRGEDTPLSIPSGPATGIREEPTLDMPPIVLQTCPTCGKPAPVRDGRLRCPNPDCAKTEELDFEV